MQFCQIHVVVTKKKKKKALEKKYTKLKLGNKI